MKNKKEYDEEEIIGERVEKRKDEEEKKGEKKGKN